MSGSALLRLSGLVIGRLGDQPSFKHNTHLVLGALQIAYPSFQRNRNQPSLLQAAYKRCTHFRLWYDDLFKTSLRTLNLHDKDPHHLLIDVLKDDLPLPQEVPTDSRPLYNLAVVPKSAQAAASDIVVCLQSHTIPFLLRPLGSDRYLRRGIVLMHASLHTAIAENWSSLPLQELNLV